MTLQEAFAVRDRLGWTPAPDDGRFFTTKLSTDGQEDGSIDRVDVDAHGRAVVVDYKHKGKGGFAAEYDVFGEGGCPAADAIALPRRVQSLIYAQVVRRMFPDLSVVGAVYLSTMGAGEGDHEIAGVVDANALDMVMGPVSAPRAARLCVGGHDQATFEELLDVTEEKVASAIQRMLDGDIEADPTDDKACSWCPVVDCERRRG